MAKRRILINIEKLSIRVEENGREIYNMRCINLAHFYCSRFAIEQIFKKIPGDYTSLKLGNIHESEHTTHSKVLYSNS